MVNTNNTKGYYGEINLKPTFSYIDAKVTIKAPEGDYGYLRISGTDYKLKPGEQKTVTYHLGDNLSIESVVNDAYKGSYTFKGFRTQWKETGAERHRQRQ